MIEPTAHAGEQASDWDLIVGDAKQGKKVFRIRKTVPIGVLLAEFSECVIVEWKYGGGLPDAETGAKLRQFEDFLTLLDDPSQNSLLMMVISGDGKREWCYYSKDYDRFMAMLNAALAGQVRFPIIIEHSADPEWTYWSKIREHTETGRVDGGPLDLPPVAEMTQQAERERTAAFAAQTAAYESAGKKIAASAYRMMHQPDPEYVLCNAANFKHLDLAFYEAASKGLQACGMDQIIDVESMSHARNYGKHVLLRFMRSSAEPTVNCVVYTIFPPAPGLLMRWINALLNRKSKHKAGVIEFETEFSNGEYVCTNTSKGKNPFTVPAVYHTVQLPAETTPAQIVAEHRRRVAEFLRISPGVTIIRRDFDLPSLTADSLRQRKLKMAHRRAIGGISREELLGLAKEKFPYVEAHVMKEMQRLILAESATENDAPIGVPEWANFFNQTDYAKFLRVVKDEFARRGEEVTIEDGQVKETASGKFYGLQNLAQVCHQHMLEKRSTSKWPGVVATHFENLRKSLTEVDQVTARMADFEEAKKHLSVRIYPADALVAGHIDGPVSRIDIEGTVTVLTFDLPDTIMMVSRSIAEKWGRSDDELFAIGLQWLRSHAVVEMGDTKLAADVQVKLAASDDFYAASRVLLLDETAGFVGKHGALIGIPHRHALVSYPINDIEVVKALNPMLTAMRNMYAQGPGSIAEDVYWVRDGKFVRLALRMDGKNAVFEPPAAFVAMLEELALAK